MSHDDVHDIPHSTDRPTVRSVQWLDEPQRRLDEPQRRLDEPQRRLDEPTEPIDESNPPSTPLLEGLATPPPLPGPAWSWRWAAAIALAGLVAFITGMALITGGFQPVIVGTPAPISPTGP